MPNTSNLSLNIFTFISASSCQNRKYKSVEVKSVLDSIEHKIVDINLQISPNDIEKLKGNRSGRIHATDFVHSTSVVLQLGQRHVDELLALADGYVNSRGTIYVRVF